MTHPSFLGKTRVVAGIFCLLTGLTACKNEDTQAAQEVQTTEIASYFVIARKTTPERLDAVIYQRLTAPERTPPTESSAAPADTPPNPPSVEAVSTTFGLEQDVWMVSIQEQQQSYTVIVSRGDQVVATIPNAPLHAGHQFQVDGTSFAIQRYTSKAIPAIQFSYWRCVDFCAWESLL